MLAIDRGELVGDDGRLHYAYNVDDEGPSSVRVAAASSAAVSSASLPHPVQSYLSDGGLTPHARTADHRARSPEGQHEVLSLVATGYRVETSP